MAVVLAATLSCTRGEPPGAGDGASDSVARMPPAPPRIATLTDRAWQDAAPVDPGTLPQTHDEPTDSDSLHTRTEALWDGIQNDDPDRALACFFPRAAYEQVKALANPASDWRYRLVANFKRDIHLAHAKLGRQSGNAHFVGLEIGPQARWVEPGEEGNKLGYYRVFGSRLRFTVDGHERTIDITSLISWRGEWYVVHLAGFT